MGLPGTGVLVRFARYNFVGALGLGLKLAVLTLLCEAAGVGYLAATAISVEAVMLHNFAWHVRWTWRERSVDLPASAIAARLLKFQLSTGLTALATNLLMVRLLTGSLGLHYLSANIVASMAGGGVNFLAAHFWVFREASSRR